MSEPLSLTWLECGCTIFTSDARRMGEVCPYHKPKPRRFYMKHSIVTAEQQPDGSWQVRGPSWLKYAEFDDADFRKCFEEIL